jgi:hypothetical protein
MHECTKVLILPFDFRKRWVITDSSVDIDKTPLEDYENVGLDDYNGEEDDECEEIEKGVFDGTQPGKGLSKRTSNYSVEEDVSLVPAWETISLDSVNGTDQTGKIYWQRIEDKFFHFLPRGETPA